MRTNAIYFFLRTLFARKSTYKYIYQGVYPTNDNIQEQRFLEGCRAEIDSLRFGEDEVIIQAYDRSFYKAMRSVEIPKGKRIIDLPDEQILKIVQTIFPWFEKEHYCVKFSGEFFTDFFDIRNSPRERATIKCYIEKSYMMEHIKRRKQFQ